MAELVPCHYCQIELLSFDRTKDHVVPRAKGGQDVRWNIVWSCRDCNSRKADSWPDEWASRCNCNFCRKTQRRHWEMFRIRNPKRSLAQSA